MNSARHHAPLVAVLAVTSGYAVLRYNVLKGVPWEHLPLYVMNKSVAWTSITLVLIAAVQALRGRAEQEASRHLSLGYTLAGLHVLASLILLGPARYPELYDSAQQLTGQGQLAALMGVLGAASALGARGTRSGPVFFALSIAGHCALLGTRGWMVPSRWPGYLVPITLLSAVTAAAAAVTALVVVRRRGGMTRGTDRP